MSAEPRVHPSPCRMCGGRTQFMAQFVDDEGNHALFHETCVGSFLMKFPRRTLRFLMAEVGTPIDLMEALKRSLAAVQPEEHYTGPKLVVVPGALVFEDEDVEVIPPAVVIDE